MKGIVFTWAWCLILAAACYDGYFAWQNREDFLRWEMNPIACWVARCFCVEAMVGLKILCISFAAATAAYCRRLHNRLAVPLTLFVACCYLWLTIYYAFGFFSRPPTMLPAVATSAMP